MGTSLHNPVAHFLGNAQTVVMAFYGLFKVTGTVKRSANIVIGTSLYGLVTHLFGNAKTVVQVLYNLFKVTDTMISFSKISIGATLSRLSTTSLAILRWFLW